MTVTRELLGEERREVILRRLRTDGKVRAARLSEELGVSLDTVRRDLRELAAAGMLRRVHGGAVPTGALSLVEPGLGERHGTRTEQKRKIAAAALDLLPDADGSVILDGGSTIAALADLLPAERRLLVATNSVPIAARLSAAPGVNLQLLGGRVRGVTQAAVGEQTLRVLDSLRVDIAFIGTNAISLRHGLSTPDSDEAGVKRAMVEAANYVVVAADSSKIGREDFVSFAPISSVDTLITDSEITAADRRQLTDSGVEVVVA